MAAAGSWFQNAKTKELARITEAPRDNGGVHLAAELWAEPGAAVFGEHTHEHLTERFTVIEGQLEVSLAGRAQTLREGAAATVPPRTAHDWWNAGSGVAHVLVEVDAAPGSGPMAARFVEMIEAGFGLANSGHTNAKGLPSGLWLPALAHEYRDVLRFTSPPALVQRLVIAPLAALARATGHDPAAAWLHGPDSPARIVEPSTPPGPVRVVHS